MSHIKDIFKWRYVFFTFVGICNRCSPHIYDYKQDEGESMETVKVSLNICHEDGCDIVVLKERDECVGDHEDT